jgi:hypothetical protein
VAGAGQYHYTDSQLNQIISKTQSALDEMQRVGSMVGSQSDALPNANRSDSGTIMKGHLDDWSADYQTVINNLTALNEKARHLLNVNRSTDRETAATAS